MRHLALLILATLAAGVGTYFDAFWAVLLYYGLTVLRPQNLWEWSLPVDVRWSLIAALLVFGGVVLHSRRLFMHARTSAIAWLLGAYGVLVVFSCLAAYNTAEAWNWGEEYLKILVVAIAASLVIRHLWQVRLMALMVAATIGYIAWHFNSLYVFEGRLEIFHKGFASLDRNGAALILAIGLPLATALAFALPRLWQKALAGFAALLMAHGIMLSLSRGGMLAGIVGLAWVILWAKPKRYALVAAVAAVIAVAYLAGPRVQARFASTADYDANASAQSRLQSWAIAWEMMWENPLLGMGVRNSNFFTENYGADSAGRTIHSVYLQIGADSGVPAMLVYISILGLACWHLTRVRRMCLQAWEDSPQLRRLENSDDTLRQTADIALGLQGSIVAFATGAAFLSLEVLELPWMLAVLAGVMPGALERHLGYRERLIARNVQTEARGSAPRRKSRRTVAASVAQLAWRRPVPLSRLERGLPQP